MSGESYMEKAILEAIEKKGDFIEEVRRRALREFGMSIRRETVFENYNLMMASRQDKFNLAEDEKIRFLMSKGRK